MTYKRIAMLSTHGYFDPVPKLGQTDTGGQVVYVLELAKAMSKNGIQVDIYTRWFNQEKPQVDPVPGYPGVRVIRIPAGPWEFVIKEEIYPLLPELAANLIKHIQANRLDYDLFHGHYVDAGIVMDDVATTLGKPSYFTPHSLGAWKREQMGGDPDEMEQKYNFSHRIAEESRLFKAVNGTSVTSSLQYEKLVDLYGFDGRNVSVIPPGVNIHKFRPAAPGSVKIDTGLPEKYIYCLSRIDSNKGHDLLLRAFDLVRQEIDDVYLVIGGGSPQPKKREEEIFGMMHSIISELGMSDRVIFTGYVPDKFMAPQYQQALLFVLPSIFEPFGMTTQEAMACGKPVVASKYGGIRTVITDKVNGMLIDPKNAREFADAMIQLIRDDNVREATGRSAHQLAVSKFSWEVIAREHLQFYSDFE